MIVSAQGLGGEKEVVIGAEIPPICVITIEIRYTVFDQALHNARYVELPSYKIGEDDDAAVNDLEKNTSRLNIGVVRHLSLLGFNPLLIDFLRGVESEDATSEAIT